MSTTPSPSPTRITTAEELADAVYAAAHSVDVSDLEPGDRDSTSYLDVLALLHNPAAPSVSDTPPCPDHRLVQQRDAKPKWCNRCGRGADGRVIGKARPRPSDTAAATITPELRDSVRRALAVELLDDHMPATGGSREHGDLLGRRADRYADAVLAALGLTVTERSEVLTDKADQ